MVLETIESKVLKNIDRLRENEKNYENGK